MDPDTNGVGADTNTKVDSRFNYGHGFNWLAAGILSGAELEKVQIVSGSLAIALNNFCHYKEFSSVNCKLILDIMNQ